MSVNYDEVSGTICAIHYYMYITVTRIVGVIIINFSYNINYSYDILIFLK